MKTKNILLTSVFAVAMITGCTKHTLTPTEQLWTTTYDFTYTVQVDSIRENTDGAGMVTYRFNKTPQIAANWGFDFWWADGIGYTFPAPENIGHGVRYTPLDPRIPDGPRVLRSFTWYMEKEGSLIANIGGNRAEILITGDYVVIHQLAGGGINEIERWYYCHRVPFGTNMDGKGAKRAYGYINPSMNSTIAFSMKKMVICA